MKDLILEYQSKWANGIVEIGKTKNNFKESFEVTSKFLYDLYDFENDSVQFKPTKASKIQFRNDFDSALSYFIGNNPNFSEDLGFALNPWVNVEFENDSINIFDNIGLAMGNYFFTDRIGKKIKVEYSFVYKKSNEFIKIILHHSSLPYIL